MSDKPFLRWHHMPEHTYLLLCEDGRVRDIRSNEDVEVAKTRILRKRFILTHTPQGNHRVYLDDLIKEYFGDDT